MDKRFSVVSMGVPPEHARPNFRIETASAVIDDSVDCAPTGIIKQVISDQLSPTGGGLKVNELPHVPDAVGDSGAVGGASTLTAEVVSSELSVPSEPPSCTRNHASIPFETAVHLLRSFDISMDWGPT